MSCITLLSDFGLHDATVAIARGILMQHAPSAQVIDISHEVEPYQQQQAAYQLSAAYASFPRGTVHVLLVDLFYDATPHLVLSTHNGHYFLSPDNGLLPAALGVQPESWLVLELSGSESFTDWLHSAGRVVNGLIGQMGKRLKGEELIGQEGKEGDGLNGQMGEELIGQIVHKVARQMGLQPYTLKAAAQSQPRISDNMAECDVLHIDHYGNVVTNMTREQLQHLSNGRRFRMQFMMAEEITDISNHYHDVREGFKLCRFNSAGYLEICINRGHAASLFGLRLGSKHNDIKIYFE